MDNSDLISICIASYNSSRYLHVLMDSVVRQIYTNFEVIFIDDGSSDNTYEVCKGYESKLNLKYYSQNNLGLSKARQLGLEKSNGKYICFVDSDDSLHESYLHTMYIEIKKNDYDICICGTNMIKDGECSSKWIYQKKQEARIVKDQLKKNYLDYCKQLYLSDSWNKLFKREFILKNKLTFSLEKGFRGNDLLFNYKVIMYCPYVICIEDCLYNHIYRSGSIVSSYKNNLSDSFQSITAKLISEQNIVFDHNDLLDQLSLFYFKEMYFSESNIFRNANLVDRKRLFKEFQENHILFKKKYNELKLEFDFKHLFLFIYTYIIPSKYILNKWLFALTFFFSKLKIK